MNPDAGENSEEYHKFKTIKNYVLKRFRKIN